MKIRSKITLGMLIAALLPLSMFWGLTYFDARAQLQDQVQARLSNAVAQNAQRANDWVDSTLRGMTLASSNPALSSMDAGLARSATRRLVGAYPWLVASFVANRDGQQIARSNDEALSNIGDRNYFKSAIDAHLSTQVGISKANRQPVLLSAAPIKSQDGQIVGVLGISAQLNTISQMIALDKIGRSGYSFLLDDAGKLVAHPDNAQLDAAASGRGKDYASHPAVLELKKTPAAAAGRPVFLSFEQDNTAWVAAAARTSSGWIMISQMQAAEAWEPLHEMSYRALGMLAAAAVLALVLALWLGGKLSGPIVRLTHVADGISKGQFDSKLLDGMDSGNDEIGALSRAIKRLAESVKTAMAMLAKS